MQGVNFQGFRNSVFAIAAVTIWFFCGGSLPAFGQESSNAVLVDQYYGGLSCHDVRHRIEILMREIASAPTSRGVVVIHGEKDKPFTSYQHKLLLEGYIRIRQFDAGRIAFVRGDDKERLRVQLWKLPDPTTNLPVAETKEWNYKLPDMVAPVIVHKESWINEECPDVFDLNFFSRFLEANPQIRGHLVLRTDSFANFRKQKAALIQRMVKQRYVPADRLRYFFVQSKNPDIEFWYVSSKHAL
jgi:hypothetical protein